ncbi:MAG: flagellar assembly protein FliW [Candidatus Sumerlaeota bacterium]
MKVETTRFGQIDVPEGDIINLPEGVLGFPEATRYVLLEHDSEGTPFKWLQSLDDPNLAFIVIDPHMVVEGYVVEFDEEMQDEVGCKYADEKFAMMAIVNVPQDQPIEMTVNVRAPIIVHTEKRVGWQVILPNEEYPIRHRLFADAEVGKKSN